MENKLQELTDRLYEEGLAKGRDEAQILITQAREEARNLIANARKEAARIKETANRDAAAGKQQIVAEIRMASRQSIASLKQNIENIVQLRCLQQPVKDALEDSKFVQELILAMIKAFNPHEAASLDLRVVLPESKKDAFEGFLQSKIQETLSKGIVITYSDNISSGFSIGPKDGSYFLRFSEEDFVNLFSNYLRPSTKKILFG